MLSHNWTDYFTSRPDNVDGNRNKTIYAKAWAQDKAHVAKMDLLTNDANAIIFAGNINHNIICLHSFVKFGGALLHSIGKIGCLSGNGHIITTLLVHAAMIAENCNIAHPTINAIIAFATLDHLPVPAANAAITFPSCVTFLLALWLVNAILKANSNDPFSLILVDKIKAAAFNAAHENGANYVTKASNHLGDFILWAWGVKQNRVKIIIYTAEPMDNKLLTYHLGHHTACILPKVPPHPAAFPPSHIAIPVGNAPIFPPVHIQNNHTILLQLANSITHHTKEARTHNELFTKQVEHTQEKEDKKKDWFHNFIKQLILFASAEDVESVPDEILDSCKFFSMLRYLQMPYI